MFSLNALKLRQINTKCSLVGPTISKSRRYSFNVDNSQISLRIPDHKSTRSSPTACNPEKHYSIENTSLPNTSLSKDGWGSRICAARAWDFYGPIFTGKLGTTTMVITIDRPDEINPNISLFHPRAFEQTIGDFLTFLRGDVVSSDMQEWHAPVQWQPIPRINNICAKFQIRSAYNANRYERWIVTPISSTHLLSISFKLSWSHVHHKMGGINSEEQHDISNMEKLCDDIMDSLEVKLSTKALAQQQAALRGLEDTSLVSEYPPLKWEQNKELTL